MPEHTKRTLPAPTLDSELARLERIARVENAPMRRYAPASVSVSAQTQTCGGDWGELCALLTRQNELLCDILGAVNALTASRLAAQTAKDPEKS